MSTPQLFYGSVWWNTEYKYISTDWPDIVDLSIVVIRSTIIIISIFYSVVVIVVALFRVLRQLHDLNMKKYVISEERRIKERRIVLSVLRNLGYPLVLIICGKKYHIWDARNSQFHCFSIQSNLFQFALQKQLL
ncbi:uncharacterized protein VTP21DRAFT_1091 [Calcarisporiella thermophila]|uniref:uncharacterized protein n=1 Tax=Calcarisporiella thermophila TaxID=911321 RepID=UPI0037437661